MIIRRIREHLGKRDWLAVLLDLVIAILGVFIGIQAANWNQGRANRAEGAEYRQRLRDDLTDNEADLTDRGVYYAAVRDHARAALAGLDRPGANDAQFLIDAFEATQIIPRKVRRYAYDEMLARGAVTWIGDPPLREQVANYYVGTETTGVTFGTVTPYRELVRQGMADVAQQAVRGACPEKVYFNADGSAWARLATQCAPLALDAETIRRAAAEVRALPGLRGALTRQISDHDGKLALIGPIVAHARELRRRLQEAR